MQLSSFPSFVRRLICDLLRLLTVLLTNKVNGRGIDINSGGIPLDTNSRPTASQVSCYSSLLFEIRVGLNYIFLTSCEENIYMRRTL
jgi:hypothetical protein